MLESSGKFFAFLIKEFKAFFPPLSIFKDNVMFEAVTTVL